MKPNLLLTVLLIFIGLSTYGQQWIKNVNQKNPTFFEIQKAFYDYNKNNPQEESQGIEKDGDYEKFKRWEWYWEPRVNEKGEFPKSTVIYDEWAKYVQSHSTVNARTTSSSGTWTFMGPSTTSNAAERLGIGRINCMAFDPNDPNTFWVGSPSGGLWKTTDGGNTWATNTDGLPVLGISDIAIDPTNSDNIYIATGDGDFGDLYSANGENPLGDTKSIGVLNSPDGGNTWYYTGLNFSVDTPQLIRRLIINPDNPQTLIAATSKGIYLTNDGGETWNNQQSGYFMDLQFNPVDTTIVYATSLGTMYIGGTDTAAIFTSYDGGFTWTTVAVAPNAFRIKLAVSAAWPDAVFAVGANHSTTGLDGLYYSNNDGASFNETWSASNCSFNLLSSEYPLNSATCDGQGSYDLAYAINPEDVSQIFLGGVNTWNSLDTSKSWSPNNYWVANSYSLPVVHADKHCLAYHPLNNSYVFDCNDGGISYTSDGGNTWNDISNGLEISQIYRICPSATVSNKVICGLQDNGTKELSSNNWYDRQYGDGTQCIIDYTNANTQYLSFVHGEIYRTTDDWNTDTTLIANNIPGALPYANANNGLYPGAWVTPFAIDPNNNQTLYVGYSDIWKSTDQGSTFNPTSISNFGLTGTLKSIAIAPSNSNTIYTATFDTLFYTHDGGTTWYYEPVSIFNAGALTSFAVNENNENEVWATFSGYTAGNKVFVSMNGGDTWVNYSDNLPNLPVNCIVHQNGSLDAYYIGTDVGVFYTDSTLPNWVLYSTGLPNVVVTDLKISYLDNKLWAGTFGRGLWQSDLYSIPTGITSSNGNSSFSIFPNPTNGIFTITTILSSNDFNIKITNVLGEDVFQSKMLSKSMNIDLSKEANGVYFAQINSETGSVTKKVVLNK